MGMAVSIVIARLRLDKQLHRYGRPLILLDFGGDSTACKATGFLARGILYFEQKSPHPECVMKLARIPTLFAQAAVPAVLIVLLSYPAGLLAQSPEEHIVSSQTLQHNLETSSATRQANV